MRGRSRRPLPQDAGVALTVRDGCGFTYRNTISMVRREINLSDLRIAKMIQRRAVRDALTFEIAGQDGNSKASRLAQKMADALRGFPAKVTVPRKMPEFHPRPAPVCQISA